jgi:hypothetical protein
MTDDHEKSDNGFYSPERVDEITQSYIDGYHKDLVRPYSEEFMAKLRQINYGYLPLSLIALKKQSYGLKCYDTATMMIGACSDAALLVGGEIALLEAKHGPNWADHSWIEDGDKVYNTTAGWEVDKELFYEIERPKITYSRTKQECLDAIKKLREEEGSDIYDNVDDLFTTIMLAVPNYEARAKRGEFLQSDRFLAELQLWKDSFDDYEGLKKQFEQELADDKNTLDIPHFE